MDGVLFLFFVDAFSENEVVGVFLLLGRGVFDGFGDVFERFLADSRSSAASVRSIEAGFLVLVLGLFPLRASSYSCKRINQKKIREEITSNRTSRMTFHLPYQLLLHE